MTTFVDTIFSSSDSSRVIPLKPHHKLLHSPWMMWALSVCFVIFQFLLQLSAGIMISQVTQSFQLTPLGVGFLASAFYLVYVTLQTPAGMLVDRMGPRRLLAGGGLVCGLGCLLFAMSNSFLTAFIGRLLMGGGSSFAFVSSLYIASTWFAPGRFALLLGLAETMGMLGSLIGNVYFAHLLQSIPWRNFMFCNTAIACFLGIGCWIVIRDNTHPSTDTTHTIRAFCKDVAWLMKHLGLFFNGLYTGLIFSVVSVFATLWAIPYLVLSQQISTPMATFEGALVLVGLAITCPIMGWIYPKLTKKNTFLAISAVLSAILCAWLIFFTPNSVWYGGILFFILGCVCSCYVFTYSLANELVPKHIRTTSVGYTNTMCMITAPLLQPFVGWVLETVSSRQVVTTSHYHWAMSIIPLCLILAAIVAIYIPNPIHASKHQDQDEGEEQHPDASSLSLAA